MTTWLLRKVVSNRDAGKPHSATRQKLFNDMVREGAFIPDANITMNELANTLTQKNILIEYKPSGSPPWFEVSWHNFEQDRVISSKQV